ncbi:MAG: hypothetical protein GWP17_06855, partial [Aquificales bacterium]|nr:hypothetical protein [Aquificales bacterium]
PPRPLPAQDVLLLCMSDENYDDTTTMSLIRYDHQNNSGENLVSGNTFMLVNPLLDDNGLVVQTFDFSGIGQWHTEIWQFDGENTSFSADDYFSFSLGQFDPTGRYAVTFVSNNDQEMPQPNLIDLASCDETSCEAIPLSGLIFWSASGGQTLVSSVNLFENFAFLRNGRMVIVDTSQLPEVNDFWLGDSRGQLPAEGEAPLVMGRGYAPFWVDEETFGYIHFAEDGESAVVVDSVAGDALRTLVTLADVQELVPDPIRTPAILRYVITHPAQPNLLIVVGLDALGQEAFVFSYDLESDALVLQMQAPVSPYHSLGFSPNGRWLVLAGAGKHELGNVNTLYVHDLEKGQTQTYISEYADFVYAPFYDWSADGNWLLFLVDSRVLSMVAPEYEYQLVFAHEQGPCSSMAWINYE